MNRPDRFQDILIELKKLLKKRKITYAMLAQELNQSESSIKRFFTASDGSMNKVFKICERLDVDLEDLLAAAKKTEYKMVHFSSEQQEYLVKHRDHFLVYWALTAKRSTIDQVKKDYKLSHTQLFSILKKLDSMNLIELLPGDQVKAPPHEAVLWAGDGPLMKEVIHEWSVRIVQEAATSIKKEENYHLNIRYLRMLPETYEELMRGLVEHTKKIENLSIREERLYPDKVMETCMTTATIPKGLF